MKWIQVDKYAEESDCKRYRVSAARVNGRWTFDAWRRAPEGSDQMPTPLGSCAFSQDARKLCKLDARAQKKAA